MSVMIGCPVRNRAWILPEYLRCLEEINYPRDRIRYCFIINDCIDDTLSILENFSRRQPGAVKLLVNNSGIPGYERGEYSFQRLAYLRNLLLNEFLCSDSDYLFSIDSDVLVSPNILMQLINDECDIVACLVCNGQQVGDTSLYNVLIKDHRGRYLHLKEIPRDRVFRVDCTGAAYLIKRKVISQHGIRYSDLYGAEDIGFCENAAREGLEIYCDGRLECRHIMRRG
ncbi:hypothetical protein ASZ90_017372 [hydrocarbon metagenome]|uniref:Glycosyltransferase 2-like domain-containing protein n=1 Tax=hydrocarbon metagenome TaxID=938273 RepID=A0A0W8E974_9ZZZZ